MLLLLPKAPLNEKIFNYPLIKTGALKNQENDNTMKIELKNN